MIENDNFHMNGEQLENETPFNYACSLGYINIVKFLIEKGALERSNYRPSLYGACANHQYEIVALLLEHINIKNDVDEESFLHIACDNGNKEIVQILICNGARVNQKYDDLAPLQIAAFNGHTGIVEILLNNNASVNIAGYTETTPLLMAAFNGHTDVVDLLVKHYAVIDTKNRSDLSPVYVSAKNGYADTVELLLRNNADVNTICNDKTALDVACLELHENVVAVLLKYNADTQMFKHIGSSYSALHLVCKTPTVKNKMKIVQMLLQKNMNINQKDSEGNTPLYYALINSDFEISELLIESGGTVNQSCLEKVYLPALGGSWRDVVGDFLLKTDELKGLSLLNCLICAPLAYCQSDVYKQKFINILESMLFNHADVNHCNNSGYSPLTTACKVGNVICIPLLLNYGVNVNGFDRNGKTPLYTACDNSKIDVVSCLLEKNANINLQCSDGSTALHAITSRIICNKHVGDIEKTILRKLLATGADINLADKNQKTVLHIVCESSLTERIIIQILLDKHPDLTLTMQNGFTALHLACLNGQTDTVACLLKYWNDVYSEKYLDRPHANPQLSEAENREENNGKESISKNHKTMLINTPDDNEQTPLHIACIYGHCGIVEILLRSGAFLDGQDCNKCTPLYLACEKHQEKVVKLLVQSNANINMASCKGWTPLHVACNCSEDQRIVKLLLQNGADKSIKDINDLTALDIASERRFRNIEELFNFTS